MNAPVTPTRSGIPGKNWAIIAAVAVLVLIASLFAVRAMTSASAPNAPGGLSLTGDGGSVKAVWNSVSGADEYTLIRDDGIVVYTGGDSSAVDKSATPGEHKYRVRASDSGAISPDSPDTKITVGAGWGTYQRIVSVFPKLLPATPVATGYDDLACRILVQGVTGEMGPGDAGSGKPLVDQRLHCFNKKESLQVTTALSKEAADTIFSDVSKKQGSESISWRYGTGYVVAAKNIIYLRPDTQDAAMIAVRLDGANKQQLIDYANKLPME